MLGHVDGVRVHVEEVRVLDNVHPTPDRAFLLPATGAEEAAPQLALQETQILNQIVQLERRREELNTAIVELRDAHMRMRDGAAATVAA